MLSPETCRIWGSSSLLPDPKRFPVAFILRDSINKSLWSVWIHAFFWNGRLASGMRRNNYSYLPWVSTTFNAGLSHTEKYQETIHECVWQKYDWPSILISFCSFKKPCALNFSPASFQIRLALAVGFYCLTSNEWKIKFSVP